jgi:TfoX/Sxy family transcriptional regulator of competence genes
LSAFKRFRLNAGCCGDQFYFKADEVTRKDFLEAGLGRFTYSARAGVRTLNSYCCAPEACFDDPDVMARWRSFAFAAALRAA